MVKIALCDDDHEYGRKLATVIEEHCRDSGRSTEVHLFSSSSELLGKIEDFDCHIAILDIVMPEVSGIELAKRLFQRNRHCIIAFLTSSADYAMQGYGVNAVGYLLKPADRAAIVELTEKCLQRHDALHPDRKLLFKINGLLRKIDSGAILYLESRNKQVRIACGDEILSYSGKLSEVLDSLPESFVQTHKSYIVNLDRTIAMGQDHLLCDNRIKIPISRQFRKETAKRYLDHVADEA